MCLCASLYMCVSVHAFFCVCARAYECVLVRVLCVFVCLVCACSFVFTFTAIFFTNIEIRWSPGKMMNCARYIYIRAQTSQQSNWSTHCSKVTPSRNQISTLIMMFLTTMYLCTLHEYKIVCMYIHVYLTKVGVPAGCKGYGAYMSGKPRRSRSHFEKRGNIFSFLYS